MNSGRSENPCARLSFRLCTIGRAVKHPRIITARILVRQLVCLFQQYLCLRDKQESLD